MHSSLCTAPCAQPFMVVVMLITKEPMVRRCLHLEGLLEVSVDQLPVISFEGWHLGRIWILHNSPTVNSTRAMIIECPSCRNVGRVAMWVFSFKVRVELRCSSSPDSHRTATVQLIQLLPFQVLLPMPLLRGGVFWNKHRQILCTMCTISGPTRNLGHVHAQST